MLRSLTPHWIIHYNDFIFNLYVNLHLKNFKLILRSQSQIPYTLEIEKIGNYQKILNHIRKYYCFYNFFLYCIFCILHNYSILLNQRRQNPVRKWPSPFFLSFHLNETCIFLHMMVFLRQMHVQNGCF